MHDHFFLLDAAVSDWIFYPRAEYFVERFFFFFGSGMSVSHLPFFNHSFIGRRFNPVMEPLTNEDYRDNLMYFRHEIAPAKLVDSPLRFVSNQQN